MPVICPSKEKEINFKMKTVIIDRGEEGKRQTPQLLENASLPDIEAGQVLVEIKACGLSTIRIDLLQELGLHGSKAPLGRDIAGIVTHVGTGVTSCRKGDEVVAVLPLDSPCSGCAEYCVVGEYDLVVKPMRVSFQDAAACIGDALTAYTALQCMGKMISGDTVFVVNGASSVGSMVVQLAQHWGGKVIATSPSAEETSYLQNIKPQIGQILETDEALKKYAMLNQCLEESGGLGVDCIIDDGVIVFPNEEDDLTLNPARRRQLKTLPTKHEIISALAVGGRWITKQSNLQIDPPDSRLLSLKAASICYLNDTVWTLSCQQQGKYLHILRDIIDKLADGVIRPNITRTVSLEGVCQIYNSLEGQTLGKTIMIRDSP
ncbi:quinone oxidoreductase-like protein 1 [Amphiura filiformis]|uniref:quinone oxidoreductase-like protein 1 n=1 Tax=Amphiura filiformis TaxID=82378 RepID=UPI003B222DEB